jgi:hypothetical protein
MQDTAYADEVEASDPHEFYMKIYLFGSLPTKGAAAGDIDLIAVAEWGPQQHRLADFEDIAYETGKRLDVFLIAPNDGINSAWYRPIREWDRSSPIPDPDVAGYFREVSNSSRDLLAFKTLFNPDEDAWEAPIAVMVPSDFFDGVDFSREVTPDRVRELTHETYMTT